MIRPRDVDVLSDRDDWATSHETRNDGVTKRNGNRL